MSRSPSLWRSLARGLLADLAGAPPAPALPRARRVVGARVGELIGGDAPVRVAVEERRVSRVTPSRALLWVLITLAGWTSLSGRSGWAAFVETAAVPVVTRCAGGREIDLALGHARSMGLDRATIRVRAAPLFAPQPAPVRIEVLAAAPDAPPAPGAVLSLRFSAAPPPVKFELAVPGEPLPDVLECRAAALEPAGLLRQRAYARGLELSLERLSGGQVQPLAADGGRTLWEYAIRVTGAGPAAGLRQLLSDLDGGDWLLHVEDLEVALDGPRARFTLEGTLVAGGAPAGGAPALLALGERRVVGLDPTDALAVLPADAALVQRVGQRLVLVTARRAGPVRLVVRGDTAREIAFTVGADALPPRPAPVASPEAPPPRVSARPPAFPRLVGTSVAEAGAHALFTDKDAREGDAIGPFRVDQVTEEGVRLSWQGRRFFVPLSGTAREEVEVDQDSGSNKAETR